MTISSAGPRNRRTGVFLFPGIRGFSFAGDVKEKPIINHISLFVCIFGHLQANSIRANGVLKMASKTNAKTKVQNQVQGAPEVSLKDLLTGIDPAKMSKAELLAFAQKAAELEKVLARTKESERKALLDSCLNALYGKAEILGFSEGFLNHAGHVLHGLTSEVSFVEYPKRDTLAKFFDKTIPSLVSGLESFDFTHYVKVSEKEYMVRIRPKAERTKKADKADNKADNKAEKAMKAMKAIS